MARHRSKKKTHLGAANPNQAKNAPEGHANIADPKSMVIRIGAQEVGSAVSQLVQDVRHVMEPDTAVRLKVCKAQV